VTLPIDGTVVVALEQAVAAPLATRHLADLGARVIKVERVGEGEFARHYDDAVGPGLSSWFVRLNRGKESIELDVKSPAGREILDRLVARADVFVQNWLPGPSSGSAAARRSCASGTPGWSRARSRGTAPTGPTATARPMTY
jgi:crotonobetainyl-CoA:carnitine CoA-transferase CaiB-like acyl-CoA transferase